MADDAYTPLPAGTKTGADLRPRSQIQYGYDATFDEGTSLVPTQSRFDASRTYAALEGEAGYWGFGWFTPARSQYNTATGFDETPDPFFNSVKRKAIVDQIQPIQRERWGEDFIKDLEKTSVSAKHMMFRIQYKMDVDTSLDTLNYYDQQSSMPGYVGSKLLNAVGNYMAVDPVTTVTTALTLGTSGFASAAAKGIQAATLAGTAPSRTVQLAKAVFDINQKFGSTIRHGSVFANTMDGIVSGYGGWYGHNKDQELVYGNLAELDDNPGWEMMFGTAAGFAGGMVGAVMHSRQFGRAVTNPYTADGVAEAFAAAGVPIPNAISVGSQFRVASRMDRFHTAMRSIPDIDDDTNELIRSGQRMRNLGWHTAEDYDELADFAGEMPSPTEMRNKIMSRFEAQEANRARYAQWESDTLEWRSRNPGVSEDDVHGQSILRVAAARLAGRVEDPVAAAKALLDWVDNRQWIAAINGRAEMSKWLSTVADDADIVRLMDFRKFEAEKLAAESAGLATAQQRIAAIHANNQALTGRYAQLSNQARLEHQADMAFKEAQHAINEGRWAEGINALHDLQEDILASTQRSADELSAVVDSLNETEEAIVSRIGAKTGPRFGERIDVLRRKVYGVQQMIKRNQEKMNELKQRLATSEDVVQTMADRKELASLKALDREMYEDGLKDIQAEVRRFDKYEEELQILYFDIRPDELERMRKLGGEAVNRALHFADDLPYSVYQVVDEAHLVLWKSHAEAAITSGASSLMEGRMFLGKNAFDEHLVAGTMPLGPMAPTVRSVRLGTGATAAQRKSIVFGQELLDTEERILLEEMAKAADRTPDVPTNVTFADAIKSAEAEIAEVQAKLAAAKRVAKPALVWQAGPSGTGKHVMSEAGKRFADHEKKLLKRLDKATKARDGLSKRMGRFDAMAKQEPRPEIPAPITVSSLRAAEQAKARTRAVALKSKIDAMVASGTASPEDIAAVRAQLRRVDAINLGTTTHTRNVEQLAQTNTELATHRRRASDLRGDLEKAVAAGDNKFATAIRKRLDETLKQADDLSKEATRLTKAIAKREAASLVASQAVRGRPQMTALRHAKAAVWQARRAIAAAAGNHVDVERITREVLFDVVGDEREVAHFPTLIASLIGPDGKLVANPGAVMRGIKLLDDGTIQTADGVIHAPSHTAQSLKIGEAKAKSPRDTPSVEGDDEVTRKLDEAHDELIGDDNWSVANGNDTLHAMRGVPALRNLTNQFRRLLTAHTGATATYFSRIAQSNRAYHAIIALTQMVDQPLAMVRDMGSKGTHIRSMHAIKAEVRGWTATLIHRTHELSQGLEDGWHIRVRSALIRNNTDNLNPIERQIAQLHREYYDRFTGMMVQRGIAVPPGYMPSMHNVGWIMANSNRARQLLGESYYRAAMRNDTVLDAEVMTRAGINPAIYGGTAQVGHLAPTDRAIYEIAQREICVIEAQRSVSRMTGGIVEATELGVVAGDNPLGLRRIRFHDMHVDSGYQRRFSNETLTDPTLNELWVHDVNTMALHYGEGSGARLAIDNQLSQLYGVNVTMSEVLFHAAQRMRASMMELGDADLEQEMVRTLQVLEEKIAHGYGLSGILRARNTSRGDAAASVVNGLVRASAGTFWGLQTALVEIPKAIWFNTGQNGFVHALTDFAEALAGDRHALNDLGVSLEGMTMNYQAALASGDGASGAVNMTLASRLLAPWQRTMDIATGAIRSQDSVGNRFIDTVVSAASALGDTNTRIGGLHWASGIARQVAARGATRQLYRTSRHLPEIAAAMRALPRAVANSPENMARIRVIARQFNMDPFDLVRMNQHGLFREGVADNMHAIIGAMNDPDELFDIMQMRGQLSDESMGSVMDYIDEITHAAVPTQRTSSAMTGRNTNWVHKLFYMLTSYTRAFGMQNMVRLGAQSSGIQAIGAMGLIYGGEVLYQTCRESLNNRTSIPQAYQNWKTNPHKEMYKVAGRIPFAGMYTSLGTWGLSWDVDSNQVKNVGGGVRPAIDLFNRVKGASRDAMHGRWDKDAEELTKLAPIYGSWQAKATMKAFGLAFD